MKAIPTLYRGIQMRSRLEATWAAFFDRMGWEWEYEPAVFDGPGWTPDFYLKHLGVFIEVKPETDPFYWADREAIDYAARRPIPEKNTTLFVGISPVFYDSQVLPKEEGEEAADFSEEHGTDMVTLAYLGLGMPGRNKKALVPFGIYMDVWPDESEEFGLACAWGVMPMLQKPEITSTYAYCLKAATEAAREAWAEAKNAIQWRPPNGP